MVGLALAVAALAVGGCASDSTDRGSLGPDEIPPSLRGLPMTTAAVGALELRVAVADTPGTRSRGLMGVDHFDTVQGMVFVFGSPSETAFHMKDVPVPLDIAFVGPDGNVRAVLTMPICAADPCPTYRSPAPFLWAVETPAGRLSGIAPGDRFSLGAWGVESGAPRAS